jgi:hypothetical protein
VKNRSKNFMREAAPLPERIMVARKMLHGLIRHCRGKA